MFKTSKEILEQARKLSQTQNSKAFDFAFLVSLLNSVYSQIYSDISGYANYFVGEFEFSKEADLPSDCYHILSVYTGNESNPVTIEQSSVHSPIPGTYYIENNTIKIAGSSNNWKVKYSKLPALLTVPDDPEEIDLDYDSITGLDDEYIYYTKDDVAYRYSLEDKTTEEASYSPSYLFNNYRLTITKTDGIVNQVLWNGEDITDYFSAYDQNTGKEIYPADIVFDNTHIAITYTNNDIYVMTSDWNKTIINPYLYKGRYFKGTALAIFGDDSTGKGMLVESDGKLYYCSFVPDTVIEFPANVFYDVLEDKLAIQLQALNGLTNDAVVSKLDADEVTFYNTLNRSNQGHRVRNVTKFWGPFYG